MRLRSLGDLTIGELVNLVANDGQRMWDSVSFGSCIYASVAVTVVAIAYTTWLIGPFALVGCGCFLIFYPVQALMAAAIAKLRRKAIIITDDRVRIMNEILTQIKLIKMYAWEDSFAEKVGGIRRGERRILEKAGYLQSLNLSMTPWRPCWRRS